MEWLESQIAEWRTLITNNPALDGRDVEELETHLRDQVEELTDAGLSDDEAFLVAVKRIGKLDEVSREFALENRGKLWRQLVLPGEEPESASRWIEALVFAVAAAVTIQVARLALRFPAEESWLLRNLSLLVLPFLAGYFARRRTLHVRQFLLTSIPLVIAALVINLYPFIDGGSTELLAAAHLPIALWFVVAHPYMSGRMRSHELRMDFVRFTGEWFIYYVLIALGGGVLIALTVFILEPTGIADPERIMEWVLPSGAAGAVVIAAWLVESKQRVVENMAPVLTMIFTPLFALMLAGAAIVYAVTGMGDAFDREMLGVFDALLVVVLSLVLYGMSARNPSASPAWMDRIQLVAVVSALLLDVMVLGTMIARIGELGFTPNRTAALGLNLLLLVSLAGTAWLSNRFLTGHGTYHQLERWQTAYLPVFALWAAVVVVILPPLFDFA
ncbi:MAG: permease prefix domain 1-containing protein [Acidimicrobiia bacterium]